MTDNESHSDGVRSQAAPDDRPTPFCIPATIASPISSSTADPRWEAWSRWASSLGSWEKTSSCTSWPDAPSCPRRELAVPQERFRPMLSVSTTNRRRGKADDRGARHGGGRP
jgi:hypothetical protein